MATRSCSATTTAELEGLIPRNRGRPSQHSGKGGTWAGLRIGRQRWRAVGNY